MVASLIFFAYCLIGISIIGFKGYMRWHTTPVGYPSFTASDLGNLIGASFSSEEISASSWGQVYEAIGTNGEGGKASSYIAFTGTLSNFIWNLKGQDRAQAIIYFQKNRIPFDMSQNEVYVEFPEHLNESQWRKAAGIWIIRRLKDVKPKSNLPYYYSEAAVKAFIPYNSLDNAYDVEKTVVFPLKKYASQLYLSEDLNFKTGVVSWEFSSAGLRFPRMFTISNNSDEKNISDLEYSVSLLQTIRPSELTLCSSVEVGKTGSVKITGIKPLPLGGNSEQILYQEKLKTVCSPQNYIHIDLREKDFKSIKIEYFDLKKGTKVNVYELNIAADDFSQNKPIR
jgi:hypothetical protein